MMVMSCVERVVSVVRWKGEGGVEYVVQVVGSVLNPLWFVFVMNVLSAGIRDGERCEIMLYDDMMITGKIMRT